MKLENGAEIERQLARWNHQLREKGIFLMLLKQQEGRALVVCLQGITFAPRPVPAWCRTVFSRLRLYSMDPFGAGAGTFEGKAE